MLLVVALLLPVLAFAGLLAQRYAGAQRARFEQEALETARRVAALIDRDLAGLQSALQTLSTSARLRAGDYQGFYDQASEVRGFIGEHVVLRDMSGQQLVNTRLPWGSPLPRSVIDVDPEVIETKRPVTAGVFTGAVAGAPLVTIVAPVVREGRVTHLISLSIATERLVPLLRSALKSVWTAGVFDRKGVFIARSERHADLTGTPGPRTFLEQASGAQGVWRGTGLMTEPVLVGYAETTSGWRVFAGAPEAVIEAPLRRALWLLAAVGLLLTGVSLAMAYAVGSRISGSVRGLAASAAWLGRGGPTILPAQGPLREANEVLAALSAASIGLRERAHERNQAEAAMRASEARFRQLAEALPQLVWIMRAEGDAIYCNERCARFYGEDWRALAGRLAHIHPDDQETAATLRADAVSAGRFFQVIVRLRGQGTSYRWHLLSIVPLEGQGKHATWVGTATDIDDLRRAEETNARLAAIVTSSVDAIIGANADGRIESWNAGAEALFGYSPEEAIGASVSLLVPPDDPLGPKGTFGRGVLGETIRTETVRAARSGQRIDVSITATPMRAADGRIVGVSVVMRDIREQKAAERHQQLLLNELNHRVKNTLATVQAIAAQTLRSTTSDADARNAFEARLIALSKVHNVLTRENWESASLYEIAAEVLAPHGGEDPDRFRIAGPDVRVHPRMALPIAMALHELATNAVKYGPLGDGGGRVSIEWRIDPATDGPRLRLRWAEEGGPPVTPPSRKGFGSRLIERSLALELDAIVSLDYAPTGVVCTIDAPLAEDGASAPQPESGGRPGPTPPPRQAAAE